MKTAAIDAHRRPCPRWHDMAAKPNERGNAYAPPGWVGRQGQNAGKRLQGQTKRLTFKEGRLRLPIGTTRLESQAFRLLRAGRWFWP